MQLPLRQGLPTIPGAARHHQPVRSCRGTGSGSPNHGSRNS